MLITLIRTPMVHPIHHLTSNRPIPDIGLAYINASIHQAGYKTCVIDAAGEGINNFAPIKGTNQVINGLNAQDIIQRIPKETEVVCLSSMHTNRWIYDAYILKILRKNFPEVLIIVGGENVTGNTKIVLKECLAIDLCVLGEGEETIVEILEKYQAGRTYKQVEGIAYLDNGLYVQTPRRRRIKKVDDLPFPRWEEFPLDSYFAVHAGIATFSKRAIPIVATRGCPHSCTFCTCSNMWDSTWYARSPARVIEEIKELIDKYEVEHIDFLDLTFGQSAKWTIEFCNKILDSNIQISWALPIGTRTEHLTDEVLELLAKAGLTRVLYSPESGSKSTLKRINKKLNLLKFERTVKKSVALKMVVKFAIIIGFPEQTWKEIFETYLFIIKAAFWGIHDVVSLSFVPYPGTVLYEQLVAEGKIDPSSYSIRLSNDLKNMHSWSQHISSKSMPFISMVFMGTFYLIQYLRYPRRIWQTIDRLVIKKRPLTTFETIVFYFFYRYTFKLSPAEDLNKVVYYSH